MHNAKRRTRKQSSTCKQNNSTSGQSMRGLWKNCVQRMLASASRMSALFKSCLARIRNFARGGTLAFLMMLSATSVAGCGLLTTRIPCVPADNPALDRTEVPVVAEGAMTGDLARAYRELADAVRLNNEAREALRKELLACGA